MVLRRLDFDLTVCKLPAAGQFNLEEGFFFLARTDEELSLVCRTDRVPEGTIAREDGWRAFRVEGTLDFSLVGILAKITGALAAANIGLFAVSTYNTDYILVKRENYERALRVLEETGYTIC